MNIHYCFPSQLDTNSQSHLFQRTCHGTVSRQQLHLDQDHVGGHTVPCVAAAGTQGTALLLLSEPWSLDTPAQLWCSSGGMCLSFQCFSCKHTCSCTVINLCASPDFSLNCAEPKRINSWEGFWKYLLQTWHGMSHPPPALLEGLSQVRQVYSKGESTRGRERKT